MTMADRRYCGICPGYGDHDTAHHGKPAALAPGDQVRLVGDLPPEWKHLVGKVGRVEACRPGEVAVAIPGRSGTSVATVPLANAELC